MNPHPRLARARSILGGSLLLATSATAAPAQAVNRATVLSPATISVGNVFRGTFSPDGKRLLYFRRTAPMGEQYEIVESRVTARGWSAPRRVDLGAASSDLYPSLSADGRHLVFASYRSADSSATGATQLWIADAVGDRWGVPRRIAESPTSAYNAEPQFAPDGSIWFTSTPKDGAPRRFLRAWPDGRVEANAIMSRWSDWRRDRFVWSGSPSPDGRTIVLTVSRIDSVSGRMLPSDLYVTERVNGGWATPRPLGGVNTPGLDNFPFFRDSELYFVRDFERIEHLPLVAALKDSVPAVDAELVMPFEYEDTRLYVPVEVHGRLWWFILDTGAQPTVLDDRVAAAAHVAGHDTTSTTGAGAGRLRRSTGDEIALRLGGSTMTVHQPAIAPIDSVLSRYTGRHAPGIVGSQFFANRAVTVDFEQRLVYARPSADAYELANSVVLPIDVDGAIPYLSATLRFAGGKTLTARLLVDLGAKSTLLLTEPFIERAGLRELRASGTRSSLGAGIGGETRYAFVRLRSLELANTPSIHLDSAVIGLSIGGTLRARGYDGLLGAEFLRRFRVTFDYPRKRLILRPRVPAPPNLDFDMSGMFIVAEGADLHDLVVADVAPGSAAAVAGVAAGDHIVSIDGRDARSMSLGAVRSLLRGPEGRRVVVEMQRGGERRSGRLALARRV